MTISTHSGPVSFNKRSAYGKFLLGYASTGAWDGQQTLTKAWEFACRYKRQGVSWRALGEMAGDMFADNIVRMRTYAPS